MYRDIESAVAALHLRAAAVRRDVEIMKESIGEGPGDVLARIAQMRIEETCNLITEIGITDDPPAVRAILTGTWLSSHDVEWALFYCASRKYLHKPSPFDPLVTLQELKRRTLGVLLMGLDDCKL